MAGVSAGIVEIVERCDRWWGRAKFILLRGKGGLPTGAALYNVSVPPPICPNVKKVSLKLLAPAVAAGLALAYAGIGFLALPALLRSQAEQLAPQVLHRQLSIAKVEFNPFTLALSVQGARMMETDGRAVFVSFDALDIDLSWQSLFRLAPVVQQVRLAQPYVHLARNADHVYSIADILQLIASQPPSPEPVRFSVNNIMLEGGRIAFDDQPAGTRHAVENLKLGVPFVSSMPADVAVFVEPLLSATVDGAPLHVQGKARPYADRREFTAELKLDKLELAPLLGYLPFKPAFRLPSGRLDARLAFQWAQPHGGASSLVLGGEAALKDVTLQQGDGAPVMKFAALSAQLGKLELSSGRYTLDKITLDGLDANVARDSKGNLNLDKLLAPAPQVVVADKLASKAANDSVSKPTTKSASAGAPVVTVQEVAIKGAALRYVDDTPQSAMRAGVEQFNLALRGVAVDTGKRSATVAELVSDSAALSLRQGQRVPTDQAPAASAASAAPAKGAAEPYRLALGKAVIDGWSLKMEDRRHAQTMAATVAPLQLGVQDWSNAPGARSKVALKATVNKRGLLAIDGSVAGGTAGNPLAADLALELKDLDLLPLQPYVTEYVNLRLTQAAVSAKGRLKLEQDAAGKLRGGYKGDASVDKLATVDKLNDNDFLSWKALALGGIDMQLAPFALQMESVTLADFFARIIIDPSGRINVQDVMRTAGNEGKSLTDAGYRAQTPDGKADAKLASKPESKVAISSKAGNKAVAVMPPLTPPVPPATADGGAEPLPPIHIGKLALSGGRVRFTDNFIKPNYTANLKDLAGAITGLTSDPASPAGVELKGSVNGAPLAINGRVHPMRRDLFLDVKAEVRGMELASLSGYADKYVGYGIEKGKLSFEVTYQLNQRKLEAQNRLILDQLTFGQESANPQATKLPVNLAVALLSDRNGVIDINVPVGGSLDDPQFSMGGIIMQIIGNAIVKTASAPFTFISSLFGGGEELSTLDFEAGRATIGPASETRLTALAKALTERPGLRLDAAGRYDASVDLDALRHVAVDRKLRAQKTRELQEQGEALPEGGVTFTKDERPGLLVRAYVGETFSKPRNSLGFPKILSQVEMEKLMLASITVDDDDLVALGNRRAQAAKDWLVKHGVPAERVFQVAARGQGKDAGCRVEFALH